VSSKEGIREDFILTEHDLSAATSRANESRYEQRGRNIRANRN
jgi:hypothetical protein